MAFLRAVKVNEVAPGTICELQLDGKTIALANVDGKFYAIDNTCLHRGGPLGQGELEGKVVTCPWHGWQYDVTTGEKVANPEIRVEKFEVRVEGDDILVSKEAVRTAPRGLPSEAESPAVATPSEGRTR